MNAFITISNVGADTGPFNLYSDIGGYTSAFETNIPKAILEAGFATNNIPTGTTQIKIKSVNEKCNNFVNVGVTPLIYYFEPQDGSAYIVDFVNSGGYAYVYGYFNGYFNGSATVPGNHIVKLNPDRSVDTSFNIGEGMSYHVVYTGESMTQLADLSTIYTGSFTTFNGVTINRILKLLPNGQVDSSFNIGTGFDNNTSNIQQASLGRLYVTGLFGSYNGVSSPRLIRLLSDGSVDTTFNVGTGFNNLTVYSLVNPDDSLYISGYFTTYKGLTVPTGIIKLDSMGNVDSSFNGGIGFNVGNLQPITLARIQGEDSFYAAGYFTAYKGISEPYIIKLMPDGSKDPSFNAGTGFTQGVGGNTFVWRIKVIWEDKLLISGGFTFYNGTNSLGIIILNKDGSIYKTFTNTYYICSYVIGNNLYATDNIDPTFQNKKIFTYVPVYTTTTTSTTISTTTSTTTVGR